MLQRSYGGSITAIFTELKNRSDDLRQAAAACGQSVGVESLYLNRQIHAMAQGNLVMATQNHVLNEETSERGRVVLGAVENIYTQIESSNKALAALEAKSGTLAVLEDAHDTQQLQLEAIRSEFEKAACKHGPESEQGSIQLVVSSYADMVTHRDVYERTQRNPR